MKSKALLALCFFGLLAGYLSSLLDSNPFEPGLVFGILISGYWVFLKKKNVGVPNIIGFIIISGIGYFVAFWIAAYLSIQSFWGAFFLGGLVGSIILLLGLAILFDNLSIVHFFSLVFLGGILSLFGIFLQETLTKGIGNVLPGIQGGLDLKPLFAFFMLWQAGMAFAIGKFAFKKYR